MRVAVAVVCCLSLVVCCLFVCCLLFVVCCLLFVVYCFVVYGVLRFMCVVVVPCCSALRVPPAETRLTVYRRLEILI